MKYPELIDRIRQHNDKLDEQYGEILADDEAEHDNIENSLEWWCNHLIVKAREEKANAAAAKELASYYTERAKSFEKKEEYRKLGIYTLVQMAGVPIRTVAGNARIQKGKESVLVNCSPEELPEKYRKVAYSVDIAAIKKDLDDGLEVNYATTSTGKSFLVIR